MFTLLVLEHWWIKLLCLHSGLPSHWGPKIRHKTRPAQQQNNKNNNKPDWKKNQSNQRQPNNQRQFNDQRQFNNQRQPYNQRQSNKREGNWQSEVCKDVQNFPSTSNSYAFRPWIKVQLSFSWGPPDSLYLSCLLLMGRGGGRGTQ